MKTKILIKKLQEADPSGEEEVCVENADIFFVSNEPAYHDGRLQVLIRDKNKEPYYDVVGAKYVTNGRKIVIRTLSIEDAIFDDEKMPVYYEEGMCEETQKRYESLVDNYRQEARDIQNKVEMGFFVNYIEKKLGLKNEEVSNAAETFFKQNLSYDDAMPEDILKLDLSWHDRRCQQWDREIEAIFQGSNLLLRKINKDASWCIRGNDFLLIRDSGKLIYNGKESEAPAEILKLIDEFNVNPFDKLD